MRKFALRLRSAGLTDPGRVRRGNEDAFIADDALGLYAVADGVGGLQAGEVASRAVIEALRGSFISLHSGSDATPAFGSSPGEPRESRTLSRALVLANKLLWEQVQRSPDLRGMGSTVTALAIRGERAWLAHAGDSRAYRFRDAKLSQLTDDHSLVAEQVRAGKITAKEARVSPNRNIITRAVGIERDITLDIVAETVRPGDRYLLCSDGLTDMVADREIAALLKERDPRDVVRSLIDTANRKGGKDNITAVVVEVE